MRILYDHQFIWWPINQPIHLSCRIVIQCQKQRSKEWISTPLNEFLTRQTSWWSDSHFDCQMSFCRCPHDVINKASENHMATQYRYAINSLTAQDITYRMLKKANLPPVFSSSLKGLQSTRQRKCQPWLPSCSQTLKWNFIDSCLWTNRTEGADKAFHVHVFCTTRRVE